MNQIAIRASALLFFACSVVPALEAEPQESSAPLTLSALVSDGMVIQRNSVAPVWGTGRPGAAVVVTPSWSGVPTRAFVEGDGTWRLRLETPAAGGPFSLQFDMTGEVLLVEDVLVGEVWLASGQSNMEWKISGSASALSDYDSQRESIDQPTLRFFDVPNRISMTPETSLDGGWVAVTPDTWPNVSAVAYYFAHELQAVLHVPIGILSAEWGGTVAESWTSEATLRAELPEFEATLDRIDAARTQTSGDDSLATLQEHWWLNLAEVDPGSKQHWAAMTTPTTDWKSMDLPATWEDRGLDVDGVVWFRREVSLPAEWAGQDLLLELGAIDDMDTTYWDGERVGGLEANGQWQTPRRYSIPAALCTEGTHTIAVRAVDTGGAGGITGVGGPLRLGIKRSTAAGSIALDGPWLYRVGASLQDLGPWPRQSWFHQNQPTALFNGMIAPLRGYGLRGAIWYQGESNRTRAAQYERLFPAMIRDWRAFFGQGDFPFLFVQIAPFRYGDDTGQAAQLRDAQRKSLSLPHTGMASTMDIGNPNDIHPKNKWEVGRRLALWARAMCYGEKSLDVSGPLFRSYAIGGSKLRITFDHAEEGLVVKGDDLTHFTIAGEDRVFHPAQATIDGATLLVASPRVPLPVAVRFAWGAADVPNLFDANGLPASSFRTDDWSE